MGDDPWRKSGHRLAGSYIEEKEDRLWSTHSLKKDAYTHCPRILKKTWTHIAITQLKTQYAGIVVNRLMDSGGFGRFQVLSEWVFCLKRDWTRKICIFKIQTKKGSNVSFLTGWNLRKLYIFIRSRRSDI